MLQFKCSLGTLSRIFCSLSPCCREYSLSMHSYSLEWHHNNRTAADDIIATSHVGPGLVYLSPDPPQTDSWTKIQEEGEITPGYWYSGGKLNDRDGKYVFYKH